MGKEGSKGVINAERLGEEEEKKREKGREAGMSKGQRKVKRRGLRPRHPSYGGMRKAYGLLHSM